VDEYLAGRTDPSPALSIGFQPAAKSSVQTATANRLTPTGARYICTQVAHRLGIPRFHRTASGTRSGRWSRSSSATRG
jgi:hypothetical protein